MSIRKNNKPKNDISVNPKTTIKKDSDKSIRQRRCAKCGAPLPTSIRKIIKCPVCRHINNL